MTVGIWVSQMQSQNRVLNSSWTSNHVFYRVVNKKNSCSSLFAHPVTRIFYAYIPRILLQRSVQKVQLIVMSQNSTGGKRVRAVIINCSDPEWSHVFDARFFSHNKPQWNYCNQVARSTTPDRPLSLSLSLSNGPGWCTAFTNRNTLFRVCAWAIVSSATTCWWTTL